MPTDKDLFRPNDHGPVVNHGSEDPVLDEIILPMTAIWGKPRTVSNEDLALSFYRTDLQNYDRDVLRQAFHQVRQEHVYQTWPSVAAFLKAADSLDQSGSRVGSDVGLDTMVCNRKAAKYAAGMFNTEEGKKAIEGGYLRHWREYIRREACRQLLGGAAWPDVIIPGEVMAAFVEIGKKFLESMKGQPERHSLGSAARKLISSGEAPPEQASYAPDREVGQDATHEPVNQRSAPSGPENGLQKIAKTGQEGDK